MDIETIIENKKFIPYLICAYNGIEYIESFSNNQKELFANFLKGLLSFFKDNKTLMVYAHNLSKFDGIFILKHLLPLGTVEPLVFNGKLITIKVKLTKVAGFENKTIIFKDSFLLLPISLKRLGLLFNTTEVKGIFPYKLYDIYYSGTFPRFEYFTNISIEKYLTIKNIFNNKIWNFKDESMKYCKLDCLILYEILIKFGEIIFSNFNVSIHKVLTLPALSMRIFKVNYMNDAPLYQIHGPVEKNIRQSYTGGAVDVYTPHNRLTDWLISDNIQHEVLYHYDVNALYPTVMSQQPIPVGKPIAFTGNICKHIPDAFGFFYVKITSPEYIEYPIIQRKVKTINGIRTIAGLGTWYDWIFSEEMYNAIKYGYTFEIIKGYEYEKSNIFSEFINKLYKFRLEYIKGSPMNETAKLIQNSLYGKFGMKDEITKAEVLDNVTIEDKANVSEFIDTYGPTIDEIIEYEEHVIIIRKSIVDLYYNEKDEFYHGSEVNIAVASAITSYARIHMSFYKNNPDFKLYYSDTDSAFINKPLPQEMVGNELGLMKLENIITKAVFLAPKTYALITEDGKEIIKVKGLTKEITSNLHFSDIEALLIKDTTREFIQEKWLKSIFKGEISTTDIIYTLKVTSNKRELIYENGIFNKTRPYNYEDIESSLKK